MRRRQQCGASRAHVPRTSSSRELRGLRPTIVSLLRLPAPMLSRRPVPRSHVAIAASGCGGDSDAEAESPPVDLANQKRTFVSPIHGFSFRPFEWGGLTAATKLSDPVIGPPADTSGTHASASTLIPPDGATDVRAAVLPGGMRVENLRVVAIHAAKHGAKVRSRGSARSRLQATFRNAGTDQSTLARHSRCIAAATRWRALSSK